jgi:hypothetical protein
VCAGKHSAEALTGIGSKYRMREESVLEEEKDLDLRDMRPLVIWLFSFVSHLLILFSFEKK